MNEVELELGEKEINVGVTFSGLLGSEPRQPPPGLASAFSSLDTLFTTYCPFLRYLLSLKDRSDDERSLSATP
jgi:hypothetical protein